MGCTSSSAAGDRYDDELKPRLAAPKDQQQKDKKKHKESANAAKENAAKAVTNITSNTVAVSSKNEPRKTESAKKPVAAATSTPVSAQQKPKQHGQAPSTEKDKQLSSNSSNSQTNNKQVTPVTVSTPHHPSSRSSSISPVQTQIAVQQQLSTITPRASSTNTTPRQQASPVSPRQSSHQPNAPQQEQHQQLRSLQPSKSVNDPQPNSPDTSSQRGERMRSNSAYSLPPLKGKIAASGPASTVAIATPPTATATINSARELSNSSKPTASTSAIPKHINKSESTDSPQVRTKHSSHSLLNRGICKLISGIKETRAYSSFVLAVGFMLLCSCSICLCFHVT